MDYFTGSIGFHLTTDSDEGAYPSSLAAFDDKVRDVELMEDQEERTALQKMLYPDEAELPENFSVRGLVHV